MTYYADTSKELARAGICQDELALYLGTERPGLWSGGGPDCSQNIYVYRWDEDRAKDIDAQFQSEPHGPEILDVTAGSDRYLFLREERSGHIRQLAGPAKPVVVANLGGVPCRVDTFLGRFTVHGGDVLRLDRSVPQRERKQVLLVFDPDSDQAHTRALLRDSCGWKPLNLCPSAHDSSTLTVMDGNVLVQRLNCPPFINRSTIRLDGPVEPDPDYQVLVTAAPGSGSADPVKLLFNGPGYKDGVTDWQLWNFTLSPGKVYDLQRLRTALSCKAMELCTVELSAPGAPLALDPAQPDPDLPGGPDEASPDDPDCPDDPGFWNVTDDLPDQDGWDITVDDSLHDYPGLDD